MEREQAGAKERVGVLVSDSSPIHTQLLTEALRRDRSLEVSSAGCERKNLLAAVMGRQVSIVVLSSALNDQPCHGLELLREIRSVRPEIRGIVLLDSSKPELILEAFRSGAKGIFSRTESLEALCKCIHRVHEGQIWASSQEMALALEALASSPTLRAVGANGLSLLSKREMEIVQSLAEGLTNREIAKRLGLSQHTVKNYLFRIFDKLGVSSRMELLFMMLNQDANSPSTAQFIKDTGDGKMIDENTVAAYQAAAEQGIATAQVALAQLYSGQRSDSRSAMRAYTWYVIANEQITRARSAIAQTMTMQQLLEAERRAAEWLSKAKKIEPSRSHDVSSVRPASIASAAAD